MLCGLALAALALLPLAAFAQYSANMQGTVQDPSGAGVSGAHLHLTNISTGQESSAVSDASGNYRFLSLAPGRYKLETQRADD